MQDTTEQTVHRSWTSGEPLRHSTISFVNPSKQLLSHEYEDVTVPTPTDRRSSLADISLKSTPLVNPNSPSSDGRRQVEENVQKKTPILSPGDASTKLPHLAAVQPDPELEEDVILFPGRKSHRSMIKPSSETANEIHPLSRSTGSSPFRGKDVASPDVSDKLSYSRRSRPHLVVRPEHSDLMRPPLYHKDQSPHQFTMSREHEAAIADCVENAESNGISTAHSRQNSAHRLASVIVHMGSTNAPLPSLSTESTVFQGNEDHIIDSQDLSATEGATESVVRIVRKGKRRSATQCLVVWEGKNIDEASWMPISQLTISETQKAISSYERAELVEAATSHLSSTEDSSDIEQLAKQDVANDIQDVIDREQEFCRAVERMPDDQIARLLSKQEELGLGSNELLLFNGLDFEMVKKSKPSKILRDGRHSVMALHERSTVSELQDLKHETEDRSLAGQYGNFDIMDFARPSLQRKSKGRKGAAPQVSDEELNNAIQISWNNDRAKKRLHNDARKEARSRGLLGKNGKADNPNKPSTVLTASQLKIEIRLFLLSDQQW